MKIPLLSSWSEAAVLAALTVSMLEATAAAADWPQWRGPNRDGISKETGLLKSWPTEGPKLLWQVKDLGSGYSTPSVAAGRIYVMSNKGLDDDFVKALDAKDGSQVWLTRVGKVGSPLHTYHRRDKSIRSWIGR
jgi:outer membrane protein assembly factor BamB